MRKKTAPHLNEKKRARERERKRSTISLIYTYIYIPGYDINSYKIMFFFLIPSLSLSLFRVYTVYIIYTGVSYRLCPPGIVLFNKRRDNNIKKQNSKKKIIIITRDMLTYH